MQTFRAKNYGLSPTHLPPAILNVLDSLTKAGFEAYIVGGGVRDLILGERPKDFDAVTNATPAQIKQVFGYRCKIIGRRFELAHVYYGQELIEVATFRTTPKKAITNEQGMILRDNHWGTIEQDFARRDFSINALYYQPRQGIILDFCEAHKDIKKRKLNLLGNAKKRFEEDPVRILRALRFAAKLDFQLDKHVEDALNSGVVSHLLAVSPHRLYDETQKMFGMGKLVQLLPLLIEYRVWGQLFPHVATVITPFIAHAAYNTDIRIREQLGVNPAFFYAVLLWQNYQKRAEKYQQKGLGFAEAQVKAGIDTLKQQTTRTAMPNFAESFIRETWEIQSRLIQPKPQHIMSLFNHPRFRAGFDFLTLREQLGESTQGMAAWWANFQNTDNDHREQLIKSYQQLYQKQRKKDKDDKNNAELNLDSVEIAQTEIDEPPYPLLRELFANRNAAQRTKQHDHELTMTSQQPTDAKKSLPHSSASLNVFRKRRRVQRDISQILLQSASCPP